MIADARKPDPPPTPDEVRQLMDARLAAWREWYPGTHLQLTCSDHPDGYRMGVLVGEPKPGEPHLVVQLFAGTVGEGLDVIENLLAGVTGAIDAYIGMKSWTVEKPTGKPKVATQNKKLILPGDLRGRLN